jgi:hypothetical protein
VAIGSSGRKLPAGSAALPSRGRCLGESRWWLPPGPRVMPGQARACFPTPTPLPISTGCLQGTPSALPIHGSSVLSSPLLASQPSVHPCPWRAWHVLVLSLSPCLSISPCPLVCPAPSQILSTGLYCPLPATACHLPALAWSSGLGVQHTRAWHPGLGVGPGDMRRPQS